MKNLILFILSILFLTADISAQDFKQVKIFLNDRTEIQQLVNIGLELDHALFNKDNSVTVFISSGEFEKLKNSSFRYEVLIEDWAEYYSNLPEMTGSEKDNFKSESKERFNIDGFGFGSMGGYYTLDEVYVKLDSMFLLYPNLITEKFQIGTSIENRPIYAVKISDNPNISESEPQVLFTALHHAREPEGMMAVMYFMYYLLENYAANPEAAYLVNNREMYFIPVHNVDGYEYNHTTNPNGGGMWRKNRRINAGGTFGVDLNRNYGFQWGYNNIGSSGTPSSETYRGTAPFSEPETQTIRDFAISHNIKSVLNYHTYGNLLLYSWGYINQLTPDDDIFSEFGSTMSSWNGYTYGNSPSILYEVNGEANDWWYGEQSEKPKAFGITPEVGSSFWPTQNLIFPLAQENLQPNIYFAWNAGEYVSLDNYSFSKEYFNPNDNVDLLINPVSNSGLSDANNISIVLSSSNPHINVINNQIVIGNIASRSSVVNLQALSFSISSAAAANETIDLDVTVFSGTEQMFVKTITIIIGTPTNIFEDISNDPSVFWTITATPANPKWEATTTSFYSSPNSYTDSKAGNYSNNANVKMTLTNPIDLTQYSNPRLSFQTHFDIEANWDYGQVEVSTNNGVTWAPVEGLFTNPGSGSFQPNGEPLYDGIQNNWVKEDIDLTAYISSQFKVRFVLITDGGTVTDGWYVDDIKIFYYTAASADVTAQLEINPSSGNGVFDVTFSAINNTASQLNFDLWLDLKMPNGNSRQVFNKNINVNSGQTFSKTKHYNISTRPLGIYTYTMYVGVNPTEIWSSDTKTYTKTSVVITENIIEDDLGLIDLPDEYSLEANYPNPFNPSTTIKYSIPKSSFVKIRIFDILGNEVAILVNEEKPAGSYEVEFSADNLTSGIYFYAIQAGSFAETKRMILLK